MELRHEGLEEVMRERVEKIAGCMHRLGRAYQSQGKYEEAERELKLAHGLYVASGLTVGADACLGDLMLMLVTTGELPGELPEVQDPSDERVKLLSAVIDRLNGSQSRRVSKRLNGLDCTDLEAVRRTATTYDRCGLKEASVGDCLIEAGHCFRLWMDCPEQAFALYEEALSLSPCDSQIYFYLALTAKAREDFSEAVRYYRQALVLNPSYVDCYFNLGNLYNDELNHLQGAEHSYLSALEAISKGSPHKVTPAQVLYMLSRVYMRANDLASAYQAALRSLIEPGVQDEYFVSAINLAGEVSPCLVKSLTQQRKMFLDGEFNEEGRTALEVFRKLSELIGK
jgi:tetratricopeptide (TPR) repeat protein